MRPECLATSWYCVSVFFARGAVRFKYHAEVMRVDEGGQVAAFLSLEPSAGRHECLGIPSKAFVVALEWF